MKIYTRSGDDGTTGLLGPGRVGKDSLRIDAYGTVDELNAALGVARATPLDPRADDLLARIQNDLFLVGSALADPDPDGPFHSALDPERTVELERCIDALDAELPPLHQFILPGGTPCAAHLHLARTICRRAERLVVTLHRNAQEPVSPAIPVYLNRLSDLLFVLARAVNQRAGQPDIPWSGL
ncbi:MAG TPA: cob(I)yrinic acid a,c-diamide adenosyltransferase [Isosphaeraceae bacterium]|nr:cob(I)yrinic acid a,c-diamide adenosyltransferase [Isosphaeraceae bacterium]